MLKLNCFLQALKVLCGKYPIATTYVMYNGTQGCVFNTLNFERQKSCPVCSIECLFGVDIEASKDSTLEQLVKEIIPQKLEVSKVSLFAGTRTLYINLPQFENPEKLSKSIHTMQKEGIIVNQPGEPQKQTSSDSHSM
eukprot:Protomagalhaensia_wolfi_Nauph_80__1785@NODE_2110_length_1210_cov_10_696840_g1650_i0_p2_GENE_NODE_2110_length_1210_cov_10_696840_g1650_i0NODE_2110_length_1210_cov_10_696840_g1650_i0_p2_ORF_typecomplete_len138_score24_73E2_bind/PF08825_10/0_00065UAE_UbL/PF14732_6/0_0013_NODE_2110_length_1210_cov_10_696840_g1650_i0502915